MRALQDSTNGVKLVDWEMPCVTDTADAVSDMSGDAMLHDDAFMASLITRGRRTGRTHTVRLKAVSHMGVLYFSRHRPDSDWYLNAAADPSVLVALDPGSHGADAGSDGMRTVPGTASIVRDPALLRTISSIKYPGQKRAAERRVAVGVVLDHG